MVSAMTAEGADSTLEALRLGAVDFIGKPSGAVSLRINELAPELIAKVRAAAGAKLKTSLRLRERVRHRIGAVGPRPRGTGPREKVAATGDGLVLVGTSTGGPPALEQLLAGLPRSFPWPILIAQHMPASFTGQLARRLDRICALTVKEVSGPVPLQPGFAYIGRGDADLIVSRRGAGLVAMAAPAQAGYLWHPSTDRLVRTALNYLAASQLVGVLMTGMGNDGAEAMALLHGQGGQVIAESEETAVVWGMPGELVKLKGADYVVPLPEIAQNLLRLVPACR
jgi:two-component system chemotaxis response regulator CheB